MKEKRKRNRPNKNTQPKVYKGTTDKVGDVVRNRAGVDYRITNQRYKKPSGYDDGKLKVRILKLSPISRKDLPTIELIDTELKNARKADLLIRIPKHRRARNYPEGKNEKKVSKKIKASDEKWLAAHNRK